MEWSKTFGGTEDDYGYSVQQTSDGGYIISGETRSYGAGMGDVWLIKTDSSGNKEWDKKFGGTGPDTGWWVRQTSDGGYIIAGIYTEAATADIWLIKTDSSGNKEWDKKFGGTKDDYGRSVQQTSDGGYIITGETLSYGAGEEDIWLIKTDSSGNKEWDKKFGGTDRDLVWIVQQTSDGGYIMTGETWSYGNNVWLIKTDSSGNKEWDKKFGGTDWVAHAHSVQQTSDGGYVIAGEADIHAPTIDEVWLIKTDSSGNKEWDKTFGSTEKSEFGYSVQQTSDGGYIISGATNNYGASGGDVWLIKTDSSGNKEWDKKFGGTEYEHGYKVQQTSDGGYIITGETWSYGTGGIDVWLIKVAVPDTTLPTYTIGLFQNPFLTRYLDVYVFPSESLSVEPIITVDLGGSVDTLSMAEADTLVYHGDHHLSANGTGTVKAWGKDLAGNVGTASESFSVQFMRAIAGGSITSPDGSLSLIIPANSLSRDTYVTVIPAAGPADSLPSALLKAAPFVQAVTGTEASTPEGRAYSLGPAGMALNRPAILRFKYTDQQLPQKGKGGLSIYALQDSRWVYIRSEVDETNHLVSATITELGTYQLRFGPEAVPSRFDLSQNYPNPFNVQTRINYDLPADAHVTVKIYNVLGQVVRVLIDEDKGAGFHSVIWDGRNDKGIRVASGVYFLRFEAGKFMATKKMLLIK